MCIAHRLRDDTHGNWQQLPGSTQLRVYGVFSLSLRTQLITRVLFYIPEAMAGYVQEYGYDVAKPTSAPLLANGPAGSLGVGLYSYKVTYHSPFGDTEGSVASASFATTTGGIALTSIPISPNGEVTHRKLFRTASGGSTYLFAGEIFNNTATTYNDILADGSIGPALINANTAMSREITNGLFALSNPIVKSLQTGITAGAGGTSAAAFQLTNEINIVATVATTNDSVKLPYLTFDRIGMVTVVRNNGANVLRIYPFDGQSINALGADTPITLATGLAVTMVAVSATAWQQL